MGKRLSATASDLWKKSFRGEASRQELLSCWHQCLRLLVRVWPTDLRLFMGFNTVLVRLRPKQADFLTLGPHHEASGLGIPHYAPWFRVSVDRLHRGREGRRILLLKNLGICYWNGRKDAVASWILRAGFYFFLVCPSWLHIMRQVSNLRIMCSAVAYITGGDAR